MQRLYSFALILTIASQSPAQAPRMVVRQDDGSSKLLRVEQADVAVRFLGDIAETVLDLRFRNDGERAVEGEFVLPLPEGATVSGYSLEVNGNLRAGVAVDKQRARTAYETVKRRMIDPGIVEREAGNIYRTKVYPVPAKGTKRLRISYNESLRADAQGLAYALPLDFQDQLGSFSCQLSGAAAGAIRVTAAAGLEFTADAAGALKAECKEVKLAGTLKLSVKPPDGPQMLVANDPQPVFFLSDRVPDIAPRPRPAPATVMLVWDASESGLNRDHTPEIALLESWFAKLGTTRVSLRLLRERLEDGGQFEIRAGRCSKLKQALQQVDYDGATAIPRLQVAPGQADLVVFVGDGSATLGTAPPSVAAPFVFIRTATTGPVHGLVRLARASGGAVIHLATDNPAEALAMLTQQRLRVLSVTGADVASTLIDEDLKPGQMLRVFGTLRERRAGKLELRYGFGNDSIITREVLYQAGGNADGVVRRLHAQRVLAGLEQQEHPDPEKIIEHCKSFGLVSDYTSLIVLERLDDYAEHQIRPPEPELQAEYNKLVAARSKQRDVDHGGLASAWVERLRWYGHRFPGYEALLLPRLRQVRIWKMAVESQFAPAQRDAEAFATLAGWLEKATGLMAGNPQARTKSEYAAWAHAVAALDAQGAKLAQTPLHLPPAGQALSVSVRGMVAKPGLVIAQSGITLRQAIDQAGGLHPLGELDNVALYRNAGKIVYNTLSAHYQDIQLFPADMLVVGQANSYGSAADPFASSPEPDDPSKEEPIREQGDLWLPAPASLPAFDPAPSRDSDSDPFASPSTGRRSTSSNSRGGGGFPTPATPSAFGGGGGGIATPATPSGRRSRGYSPPELPNQVGPAGSAPPSDPVTGVAPPQERQPKRAAAKAATARAIDRNAMVAPDLATFSQAIAAGHDPQAAYRTLKGGRFYQSNFYLAAARILAANKHADLARRVLSNLVEALPGDTAALRSYAYWLAEFGQAEEADAVLCMVSSKDPAALPVLLDRLSIMATSQAAPAKGDAAHTAATLSGFYDCFVRPSHRQSAQLTAVALTEFNALYPALKAEFPDFPGHPWSWVMDGCRQNLAADIRIVVTSTGEDDSLQLDVSEPGGAVCSSFTPLTPCGGRITAPPNMREYMIRRAVPGIYQISCASAKPTTIRAVIHSHWGSPEQKSRVVTLLLDAGKPQTVGEVDFAFQPPRP
jgi:hypothetical protein